MKAALRQKAGCNHSERNPAERKRERRAFDQRAAPNSDDKKRGESEGAFRPSKREGIALTVQSSVERGDQRPHPCHRMADPAKKRIRIAGARLDGERQKRNAEIHRPKSAVIEALASAF